MSDLSEFKPPKPNKAIIGLCKLLFPVYAKFVAHLTFEFVEGSDHPLEVLKGKPAAVLIDHADKQDPLVVIALAKHMRDSVYCAVAREVFDWHHGILGWFFQRFGCYSVNRGSPDFRSMHTTQRILTHTDAKLVLFPEGEVTGDDQSVHEINRSLMHILLNMQNEIAKSDSPRSIWVLPVGVSYRLETNLESSVNKTLKTVERHLSIRKNRDKDPATRAKLAMEALLDGLARHYKWTLAKEQPQHAQVLSLAQHICERISKHTGGEPGEKPSTEQFLCSLRNHVVEELGARKNHSPHHQKFRRAPSNSYREFLHDLDRVERLLIVQRVLQRPTSPIQICRIVDFLESELCGRMTSKGRQCASVFIGKPIEVLPHLQLYKSCKNSAIDELTACIRDQLQSALDNSHGEQAYVQASAPLLHI